MGELKRSFLGELAHVVYSRHGEQSASLAMLFPSRRARIFFSEELSKLTSRPLWEPEWLSVERLMEEISGLKRGDKLRLISELYTIYSRFHKEDFDHFYFWGEVLLADFDMVDKYRIDAAMLFRNIADLKELESDLSYLSPEQRDIINRFWQGVLHDSADSEERRHFLRIWNSLYNIYEAFRCRLKELGFGYGGMIQREASDRILEATAPLLPPKKYIVAGFNALTTSEQLLMRHLKGMGAEFYWDYDQAYLSSSYEEAGMFLRENVRLYPEPEGEITHDNYNTDKELTVVALPTNVAQCKAIPQLLNGWRKTNASGELLPLDRHTAIVLTDESLLSVLLHALKPSEREAEIDPVNVTMGFPLKQSTAYTFVERLLGLYAHARKSQSKGTFYHADVTGLLAHPYLSGSAEATALYKEIIQKRRITITDELLHKSPLLQAVFSSPEGWDQWAEGLLRALEAVAQEAPEEEERMAFTSTLAEEITKLRNSIKLCGIDLKSSTFASLLRKHLSTVRIPYEGEPLNGIQVMGILETRNLDFENVILLSMTDDNFPGKLDSGASFIPYNLRAAYALPTPEHHEGVYAYYFRRLMQRAKRVTMCYCSHADEKSTGEMSRYIRQLEYEGSHPLRFVEMGVDVNLPASDPLVVEKRGEVWQELEGYLREESPRKISPTALARYIACPLKFYFASIAHLKEKEEITDEVDNPLFGTLLHGSMERLYAPMVDLVSPLSHLQKLNKEAVIEAVNNTILHEIFHDEATLESDWPGNLLMVRNMVIRYIEQGILPYDKHHAAFILRGLEREVEAEFSFSGGRVRFAGKADRIDELGEGLYRIVDYKTGRVHLHFNGIEELFEGKFRTTYANLFQTLLYSLILRRNHHAEITPALFYVREINREEFSPNLVDKSSKAPQLYYSACQEAFEERLSRLLSELFDPNIPFMAAEDEVGCSYCEFRAICRKTKP